MTNSFFSKIKTRFSDSETLKASFLLVFWMFASRGMGVFRTALVGRLPTAEADIFNSGLVLQSNIITIFILGSIVIATLPQLAKLQKKDAENQHTGQSSFSAIYLSWCIAILSGIMAFICLFLIVFTKQILELFNPELLLSFEKIGKLQDFIWFNQIALIGPIVFAIKSLFGVFLNLKKEYKIYSIEGILNNFGSLLGLTVGYSLFGILGASIGALLGLSFALIGFAWDASRLGFRFNLGWFEGLDSLLWSTLWLYLPRLCVYSNIRAAETMVSVLSSEANGQISAFQYALDIQGIFLGVIMAVATVFLPNLASMLVNKGRDQAFWEHLLKYLKISLVLSAIGAVITIFATPGALWLFKALGRVNASSFLSNPNNLNLVGQLSVLAAFSLIFQSVAEILSRYFTAIEKVWQSIIASVLGNLSAVVLAFILIKNTSFGSGIISASGLLLNSVILCSTLMFFTYRDWQNSLKTTHLNSN